jgi:dTDP-glucose 4,6-dehydratase
MKILVIGSSSFSGRSFIKYQILKNPSLQIVGVNRTSLKETPFDPLGSLKNEIQEFNMDLDTDCNRIAKLVKEFEITHILNFAAMSMVAESWNNPSTWYRTNVESLANLIRALDYEDCKIEKFIQFSTPEVYGNTNTLIKENWSFAPSTPYAISRAAGDWHLKSLYDTRKFPVIFTRAANVFGEHQRLYRIVPKTIFSILRGFKLPLQGGGKSVRSFIHIDDVSSVFLSYFH